MDSNQNIYRRGRERGEEQCNKGTESVILIVPQCKDGNAH